MNERTEDRLRAHLGTLDSVAVPGTGEVEVAVQRARRRHERRRRAAAGVAAVALVATGGVAAWRSTSSREGAATSPTTDATIVGSTVVGSTVVGSTVVDTSTASTTPAPVVVGADGGWAAIPPNPRGPLTGATVVWTGTEAIAVGGTLASGDDAGVDAYDPATQQWRAVSDDVPLLAPIIAWTGSEVLAVGWTATGAPRSVAATLDVTTGEWTVRADSPLPDKLWSENPWVWTGSELLVATGEHSTPGATFHTIAYDPATDRWRALAAAPLAPRNQAASVWTGSEWIVWGGNDDTDDFADGAAYDPAADSWRPLPASPLSPRRVPAVWTGTEMILAAGFGGGNGINALGDGAAYDPATDTWRSIADGPAHPGFAPQWTGRLLLLFAKGGVVAYDPVADAWHSDDLSFGAVSHDDQSPVWTGTAVLLLGSYFGETGGAVFIPPA